MVGRVFLGRYEIVRLLGEGGMARVYLARQVDLGRQVVIKVMHDHIAADPKFRDRFERETLLMARFQHPYCVTLYDASLNDPQGPCIVMEYIKGLTLDALLARNGRLHPPRIGRLLGQLCEVLAAAHAEGIIHRDLKPANLMVIDAETPYEKIKVMDFGLAKLVEGPTLKKITESNLDFAVGTPGYICPEQVRGEESDHRGDIYSLGIILYEMLAGRLPFSGRSTMDVLLAHATEPPPSFSEIGASDWISPEIEAVVRACLAKDPQDRPQSARDLAERYERALMHYNEKKRSRSAATTTPPGEPAAASASPAAPPPTVPADPMSLMHHLEAWMPEKIAVYKLRGFVHDVGGTVIESVPGLIRVRLGGRGSFLGIPTGKLSWLSFSRSSHIEMDLRMHQADAARNKIHITVVLRVPGRNVNDEPEWKERCEAIYCDLRAYLMGASESR